MARLWHGARETGSRCEAGAGHSAHVPRLGLRPSLLLYFAAWPAPSSQLRHHRGSPITLGPCERRMP